MKRLFYFMLCMAMLVGCSKDKEKDFDKPDEPEVPETPTVVSLGVSEADLIFEAAGGEKTFTITCNTHWTIMNESDWCTTDVTTGTGNRTVIVKAQSYGELEDRNMNLTVKAGENTKVLTVTQKYGNAIIPDKAKFEVAQGGGDLAIKVRSSVTYKVTIPKFCNSWIQPAPETRAEVSDTTYRFIISENESEESRTGYIVFAAASLQDTVRIYQAQKGRFVLTQMVYRLFGEDTTITVDLKTNVDYEVSIVGDAASWISPVETRSLRVDRLQFHIKENTNKFREGKIVFKDKNSDLTNSVYVIQYNKEPYCGDIVFQTKQELINFHAAGKTKVIGNVTVQGSIGTLWELGNSLVEIDGDLILKCDVLKSLDGLGGLKRITGSLVITEGKMTTLTGLNNLESIGGDFEIKALTYSSYYYTNDCFSLGVLESFVGLDNLESIGGSFKVISSAECYGGVAYSSFSYSLNSLKSFAGLSKLKSIGGDFEVNSSASASSAPAYYDASASSLVSLRSFDGLDNLESIGGSFKVISSAKCGWRGAVSSVSSSSSLVSLKSFAGLNKLKSIGGDFKVYSFSNSKYASSLLLTSFEGLDNLKSVQSISIIGCPALSDLLNGNCSSSK